MVASYKSWVIFMEGRKSEGQKTPNRSEEMPKYSKEEIEKIYRAQDKEMPRGRDPDIGKMLKWDRNCRPWCGDLIP